MKMLLSGWDYMPGYLGTCLGSKSVGQKQYDLNAAFNTADSFPVQTGLGQVIGSRTGPWSYAVVCSLVHFSLFALAAKAPSPGPYYIWYKLTSHRIALLLYRFAEFLTSFCWLTFICCSTLGTYMCRQGSNVVCSLLLSHWPQCHIQLLVTVSVWKLPDYLTTVTEVL